MTDLTVLDRTSDKTGSGQYPKELAMTFQSRRADGFTGKEQIIGRPLQAGRQLKLRLLTLFNQRGGEGISIGMAIEDMDNLKEREENCPSRVTK
ncbi:MAG: hypothetical protein R3C11_17095 [Planctomycetaceae bacterium]